MLFNSVQFILFFPLVTALYFLTPCRFRWLLLLAASCIFYMVFIPIYILILAFTILIDYWAGLCIEKALGKRRKWFLVLSLAANVGVLAFFKYYNFFTGNVAAMAQALGWNYPLTTLSIILPIGLSFHTFQAMSYTIEVYRGHYKAERHLGIYALYVMFYPQLVAGPIERPQNLLPQFHTKHDPDPKRITEGLRIMLWGFFKKIVIADNLAVLVTIVFKTPSHFEGPMLLLACAGFFFQLYCDFSGYSDIAIGSARVMGIHLMKNFDRPYAAASTSEFWRRWHISLSTWFKDYVFVPLGGSRTTPFQTCRNLMIVFLLSGLWHGAAWPFVIWGFLNGLYLSLSILTVNVRQKVVRWTGLDHAAGFHRAVKIGITFALISFSLIFFRAESIRDACYIVSHLFSGIHKALDLSFWLSMFNEEVVGLRKSQLAYTVFFIAVMIWVEGLRAEKTPHGFLAQKPTFWRWAVYYAVAFAILFLGNYENRQFIYFQF
jgi:D-alanyl-lipoteichoic acid acyltransferase DltB (MBOAT superfamily)